MRPSQARTARETEAPPTAAVGELGMTETAHTAADRTGATGATRRARSGRGSRRETMPPPVVLDRYVLQRRLGSGAFGTVWMARDERLERDVAVKMLPRERIVGGRFEREARVAARLSHPGIVTLYEASMDDEGAYLVSELVRGTTLDRLLEAGRLSDRDIVDVGVVLCDALEHAHGEGVVHRDVKPSNVLVPERPASPAQLAKLTDFGVARVIGGDTLTRTGDIIGTLAYMAPEQAEGLEAGPSADLYSLALVLYEALTGVNPALAPSGATRHRRLGTYMPPLRRQRRDLPRELGSGIDLALRPRARERGRILDLRRALVAARDLVGDETGVVGDGWAPRERLLTRERPVVSDDGPARVGPARGDDYEPEAAGMTDRVWVSRGLGALGAGATAAWLSAHALTPAPLPPAVAALICAAMTLLLPRLGWLTLTLAVAGLTAAQGHGGLALVIVPAALSAVVLIPWRSTSWPLPAGATALGLIGLAGAWPAVAGWTSSVWRRAALGAAGWMWLALVSPIAGRGLYLNWLPATPATGWEDSVRAGAQQVLNPLLSSGVLAPAAVWAVGAAVLPWLVRGRSLVLDVTMAVIWSATVVSASTAVLSAVHGSHGTPTAPAAVLGAVVGAALALGRPWFPAPAGVLTMSRRPTGTDRIGRAPGSGARGQFP
jgi:eukaryotic-like serine/threonine-protein kinase